MFYGRRTNLLLHPLCYIQLLNEANNTKYLPDTLFSCHFIGDKSKYSDAEPSLVVAHWVSESVTLVKLSFEHVIPFVNLPQLLSWWSCYINMMILQYCDSIRAGALRFWDFQSPGCSALNQSELRVRDRATNERTEPVSWRLETEYWLD